MIIKKVESKFAPTISAVGPPGTHGSENLTHGGHTRRQHKEAPGWWRPSEEATGF